jgi:hypothetical protein
MKSCRIYVASSWRNAQQETVVQALRDAGHEVYDFRNPSPGNTGFRWSEVDPEWQQWTTEQYRDLLRTSPAAAAGFKRDFDAMQWADTCVLVLPSGRSAHIEAGWMKGAGRRVFVLQTTQEEPELMYRMTDGIAVSIAELLEWVGR